jgi:hypothetical protein
MMPEGKKFDFTEDPVDAVIITVQSNPAGHFSEPPKIFLEGSAWFAENVQDFVRVVRKEDDPRTPGSVHTQLVKE